MAFRKVLKGFEIGGLPYAEVQFQLKRLLAAGASADELREILRRSELIEPLPEYAHREVLGLLDEATELEAGQQSETEPAADASAELDAVALAADLETTRAELESEQTRIREIEDALATRIASEQTMRSRLEQASQETERYQAELRAARNSLASRDKVTALMRQTLDERDAQLAGLRREHAELERALADRNVSGSAANENGGQAQRELARLELARLHEEMRVLRDSITSREKTVSQLRQSLAERDAHIAALRQSQSKAIANLEARAQSAELELQALQGRAKAELDRLRAQVSRLHKEPREFAAPLVFPRAEAFPDVDAALAPAPPPQPAPRSIRAGVRGWRWNPRATSSAVWAGVAIVLVAAVAWFFAHHPYTPPQIATAAPVVPLQAGSIIQDCPNCPALTVLPTGRFEQGSGAESASAFEKPLHWVMIVHPIALSTDAVTVDEFRAFIAATGRDMQGCDTYDGTWRHRAENNWENPGFVQSGSHPVTCTSWNDAKAYAAWLSAKTGHRYRLPSASEWEYAARAGAAAAQPWSADGAGACASANVADQSAARRYPGWVVFSCDDGYIQTSPVGSFKANSFGLNDMLGNVFQWTEDCWHADYKGAPIDGSARMDGDCSEHELRGGSWFSTPSFVRADYRNHFAADYRTSSVGIRLVREIAS